MFRTASAVLLLFILSHVVFAQVSDKREELLMMSGKVIEGVVTGTDTAYIYYDYHAKGGKVKPKKLDLERVFSIYDAAGNETVVYQMDTMIGNYFSEEEMRMYIQGEQDAMSGYRANWIILLGLPVTGGLGFFIGSNVAVFTIPFAYLLGASLPGYRVRPESVSDASYLRSPAYMLGYERTAKNKRLFKALVTGLVGTTVGFVMSQTVEF